jgi:hypothetical protein
MRRGPALQHHSAKGLRSRQSRPTMMAISSPTKVVAHEENIDSVYLNRRDQPHQELEVRLDARSRPTWLWDMEADSPEIRIQGFVMDQEVKIKELSFWPTGNRRRCSGGRWGPCRERRNGGPLDRCSSNPCGPSGECSPPASMLSRPNRRLAPPHSSRASSPRSKPMRCHAPGTDPRGSARSCPPVSSAGRNRHLFDRRGCR